MDSARRTSAGVRRPKPARPGNSPSGSDRDRPRGSSLGVIAAGVQRPDFPTRFDLLLMNVVANQAATSLQGAQLREVQALLGEQRRIEDVLRRSEERFRAL